MRKRLAQIYIVFFLAAAGYALYVTGRGHPLFAGLSRKEAADVIRYQNPLNRGFMRIGQQLGHEDPERYKSKALGKARRIQDVKPVIPERCFFMQEELDDMSDEDAERAVNEAVNFIMGEPGEVLELEEVKDLDPESQLRKNLNLTTYQNEFKTPFITCFLYRLRAFGEFAEIAVPAAVKALERPGNSSAAADFLSGFKRLPITPEDLDTLLTLLASNQPEFARDAARAVGSVPPEVAPRLISMIFERKEDEKPNFTAVRALFMVAAKNPEVDLRAFFSRALHSDELQLPILTMLKEFPKPAAAAQPELVKLIELGQAAAAPALAAYSAAPCDDAAPFAGAILKALDFPNITHCDLYDDTGAMFTGDPCGNPAYRPVCGVPPGKRTQPLKAEFVKFAAKCSGPFASELTPLLERSGDPGTALILEILLAGGAPPRDSAPFTKFLESRDPWIFASALALLSRIPGVDLARSYERVMMPDFGVCMNSYAFVSQLALAGNEGVKLLIKELKDPQGKVRPGVCAAFKKIPALSRELVSPILLLIENGGHDCLRTEVPYAIAKAEVPDAEKFEILAGLWPRPDEFVCGRHSLRTTLIKLLVELAAKDIPALDKLTGLIAALPAPSRTGAVDVVSSYPASGPPEKSVKVQLHIAPYREYAEPCLDSAGAPIKPTTDPEIHRIAARGTNLDMTRFLSTYTGDINARGLKCKTPLLAAVEAKNAGTALLLIEKGADMNLRDQTGIAPLLRALYSPEDFEMIALLANRGANPNTASVYGETPLRSAIRAKRPALAQLLLEKGADPDYAVNYEYEVSPLFEAVDLLNRMEAGAYTSNEWMQVINLMLERKVDLSFRDKEGNTILHRAAIRMYGPLYNKFVEAGADTAALNCDGRRPEELRARIVGK